MTAMVLLFVSGKKSPVANLENDKNFLRIRCPKCQWEPRKYDTWVCSPGCGHWWNTFDTYGLCPGCQKQWGETECLRCSVMSPHDLWYESVRG